MIAVPSGLMWPSWMTEKFASLWDAWAAHLNPRYYAKTAELAEIRDRLDACRNWLRSLGL